MHKAQSTIHNGARIGKSGLGIGPWGWRGSSAPVPAGATRTGGGCGVAPGQGAGPVLRVLRERLERELGMEYWQQYAQNAAARLADAGIWPAALSLYAHYAPRPGFIDALGRTLRDARVPAPEEIAPWLERASDEEAAQDAEGALAKAEGYQERGAVGRALTP